MTEETTIQTDPSELRERLATMRKRFEEFRGRL